MEVWSSQSLRHSDIVGLTNLNPLQDVLGLQQITFTMPGDCRSVNKFLFRIHCQAIGQFLSLIQRI